MLSAPTPILHRWLAACALFLVGCQPSASVQSEVEFTLKDDPGRVSSHSLSSDTFNYQHDSGTFSRQSLSSLIFDYLEVPDLRPEQLRVVDAPDNSDSYKSVQEMVRNAQSGRTQMSGKRLLQFVLKEPLSPLQVEHISAALMRFTHDRQGMAKLVVQAGPELDGFLGTSKREFDLPLFWQDAQIEPYAKRLPGMGLRIECRLTFKLSAQAVPKLQGTLAQIRGLPEAEPGSPAALRRATLNNDMLIQVPHEITYKDALLDALNGRLGEWIYNRVAFNVGSFESDTAGLAIGLDVGGQAQEECRKKMSTEYPAIAKRLSLTPLVASVSGFDVLRHRPQSAK
jgi:hypothetical protein